MVIVSLFFLLPKFLEVLIGFDSDYNLVDGANGSDIGETKTIFASGIVIAFVHILEHEFNDSRVVLRQIDLPSSAS
jgi:hypothetical protein